jgi:hypothetical protein
MGRLLLIVLLAALACPAWAQEFLGLGGIMQQADTYDRTASWQLEYQEGLGEHFAFSIGYLNEGHVPDHHRDGHTAQLWTRTTLFDRRLSLAAGAGPFYYFDTVAAKSGASYANDHGWGANLSLAATWYTDSRWLFQLRTNLIEANAKADTLSALVGIGYQLEAPATPGPRPTAQSRSEKTTNNELTVFLGRTIVNSFHSEHSVATAIEYRRGLLPYMDWTLTWLYEGDNRLSRRNGVCTQLWAVRDFFADRLTLGFGGGLYFNVDHYLAQGRNGYEDEASGIATLTSSYRFDRHWDLRSSWNRIVTNYNADTDMILAGVGYRF